MSPNGRRPLPSLFLSASSMQASPGPTLAPSDTHRIIISPTYAALPRGEDNYDGVSVANPPTLLDARLTPGLRVSGAILSRRLVLLSVASWLSRLHSPTGVGKTTSTQPGRACLLHTRGFLTAPRPAPSQVSLLSLSHYAGGGIVVHHSPPLNPSPALSPRMARSLVL